VLSDYEGALGFLCQTINVPTKFCLPFRSPEEPNSVWLSIGRIYHRITLSADKKQIKVIRVRKKWATSLLWEPSVTCKLQQETYMALIRLAGPKTALRFCATLTWNFITVAFTCANNIRVVFAMRTTDFKGCFKKAFLASYNWPVLNNFESLHFPGI